MRAWRALTLLWFLPRFSPIWTFTELRGKWQKFHKITCSSIYNNFGQYLTNFLVILGIFCLFYAILGSFWPFILSFWLIFGPYAIMHDIITEWNGPQGGKWKVLWLCIHTCSHFCTCMCMAHNQLFFFGGGVRLRQTNKIGSKEPLGVHRHSSPLQGKEVRGPWGPKTSSFYK